MQLTKRVQRAGWLIDSLLLGVAIVCSFRGYKLTAFGLFVFVAGLFIVLLSRPRTPDTRAGKDKPFA